MRLNACDAELAWIVPKTRCPVSEACSAASNVSLSRISPMSTTSGFSRTIAAEGGGEVRHVEADLPLVDHRLLVFKQVFDRVLDRQDVAGALSY